METLETVVSKLKENCCKTAEIALLTENYGLKSCLKPAFDEYNSDKLEIIFLSNICYLDLSKAQYKRLANRNYKQLFITKTKSLEVEDIELKEPSIVTIINNNNSIVQTIIEPIKEEEQTWEQTDW